MEMKRMAAYRDGLAARLSGKELKDNPHSIMSPEAVEWMSGWKDQDRHLRQRDEALDSIGWFG